MSNILPIHKEKTIDQNDNKISYFTLENSNSKLSNYNQIIGSIASAEKFVCIATTGQINQKIIEVLYSCIDKNIRVYIIFKSFEYSANSLVKFSKKKPALIRQVSDLANNMIIVDGNATLFINEIGSNENIGIDLSELHSKDVFYLFNYYFWDKSDLEKKLDEISEPKESPYPPLEKINDHVNLVNSDKGLFTGKVIVPFKSENREYFTDSVTEFSFSKDINSPIISNEQSIIGNFRFNSLDIVSFIGDTWKLHSTKLKDISSEIEIIPIENNWNKSINVKSSETVEIQAVRSGRIDDMKILEPNEFPEKKFSKLVTYKWIVLPPTKPKGAKLSQLYKDFDNLVKNFNEDLDYLDTLLDQTVNNETTFFITHFLGRKTKAEKDKEKIVKYRNLNLRKINYNELKDFVKVEFADYFNSICKSQEELKNEIDEKKQKKQWDQIKEDKERKRDEKATELEEYNKTMNLYIEIEDLKKKLNEPDMKDSAQDIENRIKELESELHGKPKQEKLNKKINNLKGELKGFIKDLENNYSKFVYQPRSNELKNLKKGNESITYKKYQEYTLPKFALPEVGELYEDTDKYYLEISKYSELDKAKNIITNRYTDKASKIVVKEI